MQRGVLLLAAAALLTGCGSSSKSSSAPAAPVASAATVTIKNFLFVPASTTVRVGGTVTWTNQDSSEHTATPDSGTPFADTGTLSQNHSSKAITFKTAGTFAYHCAFHAFMHGTVVVTA